MSLLSYNELIAQVVSPLVIQERDGSRIPDTQVNASSIDIRLGSVFLQELEMPGSLVDYRARDRLNMCTYVLGPGAHIDLQPGEFILAESREKFFLPDNLSFEYKLKSSMARVGLEHLTAGWADAGWTNSVLTLELKNMSRHHTIRLRPDDLIGQITFFQHTPVPPHASYAARGRYNNDLNVSAIKP